MSKRIIEDGVGTISEYLEALGESGNVENLSQSTMASLIDHTLLKPEATEKEIVELCSEADQYSFKSVCINPYWIPVAAQELKGSKVKVCTVIGFPLGVNTTATKFNETADALKNGADEIDMVVNIGALKSGDLSAVENDIEALVNEIKGTAILKVILETCLLTPAEIESASKICMDAGAQYVKTSTGFSSGGATIEAISIMRKTVGNSLGVKASGGIRDRETAIAMIHAGATRIGASAGIAIVTGKGGAGSTY